MVDKHHETQEQSIKARKHQLFEADAPVQVGSGRPFREFLRTTPAAPLSGLTRAALWAAGVVVALVLVAALFKTFNRPPKAVSRPASKAAHSSPQPGAAGSIVKTCTGPRQRSSTTYDSV
jgi:hypothetical protein